MIEGTQLVSKGARAESKELTTAPCQLLTEGHLFLDIF